MPLVIPPGAPRVRFGGDDDRWWQVRARDDRYLVLTAQVPGRARGVVHYTIVDLVEQVRGPCDQVAGDWRLRPGSLDADARRLLAALRLRRDRQAWLESTRRHAGDTITWPDHLAGVDEHGATLPAVGISHRNRVPVIVAAVIVSAA